MAMTGWLHQSGEGAFARPTLCGCDASVPDSWAKSLPVAGGFEFAPFWKRQVSRQVLQHIYAISMHIS